LFIHLVQWALTLPNLRRHRCFQLPLASFLLLKSFYELYCVLQLPTFNLYQLVSPICLVASTLWCVNQYVRVLLYESFFHSGISKLARQPYVLECFALMFCSSNACLSLSDPPTLTLIIPL
jgi:hypothetical protein